MFTYLVNKIYKSSAKWLEFHSRENNVGVLKVLNLTTPLATKGWLGQPHGAKGVAGTTPMKIRTKWKLRPFFY
jgi:hypothetical protein